MKKNISIIAFLIASINAFAQIAWPEEGVWPESPSVRAIREVTMPGPAIMTGACEFSVPLYTIQVEGVSIPLSLSYHSNGIRPGDDPHPIGYGWTLTPPLRVTRQIVGRPDEYFEYKSDSLPHYDDTTYPVFYKCVRKIDDEGILSDYRDAQHDIFTIHLLDKSITCILDRRKFIGIDCDEYRIELDSLVDPTKHNFKRVTYSIKVTDPRGVIYDFSTKGEYTEHSTIMLNEWLLSSITLPSGRQIEFAWIQAKHSHRGVITAGTNSAIYSRSPLFSEIFNAEKDSKFRLNHEFGGNKNLEEIRFPGGTVTLTYRNEVVTKNITDMLSTVEVRADDKRRVFHASLSRDGLLLSEVVLNGRDTYTFAYDPQRFSHDKEGCDWWGFYNNSSGECLSPKFYSKSNNYGVVSMDIPGADRSVNAEAMRASILIKATYPTGGLIEWDYEPHRFATQACNDTKTNACIDVPTLNMGGGLRVKSITLRESADDPVPRIRTYTYGPDDNGLANIVAAPLLNTFILEDNVKEFRLINDMVYECADKMLTINAQSDYLTGQTGAVPIWYSQVTETEAEGKTVYVFRNLCSANEVSREWGKVVATRNYTTFSKGPQLISTTMYAGSDGSYRIISKTTNNYELSHSPMGYYIEYQPQRKLILIDGEDAPDFGEKSFIGLPVHNYSGSENASVNFPMLYRNKYTWFSAQPLRVEMQTERLVSTTTTVYTDDNKPITTTERYEYVDGTALHRTIVKSNAARDVQSTQYTYPQDAATMVAGMMKAANVLATPLSVTTAFNGSTITYAYNMVSCNSNGRVFRPSSISLKRTMGQPWTKALYTNDSCGNLIAMSSANVSTAWTWDSAHLYPITQTVGGNLTSSAEWLPLVGVATLTSPAGVRQEFGYNDKGELTSVRQNGRLIEQYEYTISPEGNNSVTTKHYTSANTFTTAIERYDGLGRPTVSVSQTGPDTYAATATEYDAMGRPYRTTCPVTVTSDATVADVKSAAPVFYSDSYPFTLTEYEQSQRARATATIKAGSAWHSNGKKSRSQIVSDYGASIPKYNITSSSVTQSGTYTQLTLTCERSVDEDGNFVSLYKDMRGLVVGRYDANGATSYVYDNYGDLRYVLPPGVTSGGKRTDDKMQQLAYWYDYDDRGNCILKKIPGCKEARYAYDPAGRLVAEQSAHHADGTWRLYGYDNCGRQVLVVDADMDQEAVKAFSSVCRTASLTDLSSASTGGYVLSPAFEFSVSPTLVLANYYDNYDFADMLPDDFYIDGDFTIHRQIDLTPTVPLFNFLSNPIGLLTGIATGQGFEQYYYNKSGMEIQRQASGYNVGRRTTTYTYDLKPDRVTYRYPSGVMLSRTVKNTYDEIGRVAATVTTESYDVTISGPGITDPITATLSDSAVVKYSYDLLGRVATMDLGRAKRYFSYDIHSWPTLSVTTGATGTLYSERLMYADGTMPRYNGRISSKVIPGGRYDYAYTHGFLTKATYAPTDGSQADFSTAYTYDARGNMLSLQRHGVIDVTPDGTETFGLLDDIDITATGNQITRLVSSTNSLPFNSAAGFSKFGQYDITYDASGRVKSDDSRGISSITYNNDGRPVSVKFFDGHRHENTWDGLGRLICTTYYLDKKTITLGTPTLPGNLGGLGGFDSFQIPLASRRYTGDGHIIRHGGLNSADTLELAAFDGGYFAQFKPRYHITDYQGNVVGVCNYAGRLEQRADYYPYGELHREPTVIGPAASGATVNPFFYTGMERQTANGLSELAYPARQYAYKVPFFTTTDNLCEEKYHISPYIMCSSDPVNRIDPSGLNDFIVNDMGYIFVKITDENDRFYYRDSSNPEANKELDLGKKVVTSTKTTKTAEYGTDNIYDTTILEISDDESGKKIFEFLADNTKVEYSRIVMDTESDGKKNYVGTTNQTGQDLSFIPIIFNRKDGELPIRYDHNHPSKRPDAGPRDIMTARTMANLYNDDIECNVYVNIPTKNRDDRYHPF